MKDRITKEDINDLLYDIRNEFENELDTYESKYKEDLTEKDFNIMFEFIDCFLSKTELMLNDLYEDFEKETEID